MTSISKKATRWVHTHGYGLDVIGTYHVNFGPIQLYCFHDPGGRGFRWKIGSVTCDKFFKTMDDAKTSGVRALIKLAHEILEGVYELPEYDDKAFNKEHFEPVKPEDRPKKKAKAKKKKEQPDLDNWHLSILGLDR